MFVYYIIILFTESQLRYIIWCHFQNVPRQAGAAEEASSAAEGWYAASLHEEDEEAGSAVQRTTETELIVGQTRAGTGAGGIQE